MGTYLCMSFLFFYSCCGTEEIRFLLSKSQTLKTEMQFPCRVSLNLLNPVDPVIDPNCRLC